MKEVDEMEAGRELDALVAEKAMGYKWWVCAATDLRGLIHEENKPHRFQTLATGSEPIAGDWDYRLPRYSTDIAAAFEVAEKLRAFSLSRHSDGSWHCWHWNKTHLNANAETVPLAICRAALKVAATAAA